MKSRDIKPIIEQYDREKGLFRRLRSISAIKQLQALHDPHNENKDVSFAARQLLAEHWQEIKGTSRSYVNSNLKATERAYIRVAEFLDTELDEKKGISSSYVKIATLMPSTNQHPVFSFTDKIEFRDSVIAFNNRILCFTRWVDEIEEKIGKIAAKSEFLLIKYLVKQLQQNELIDLRYTLNQIQIPKFLLEKLNLIKAAINIALGNYNYLRSIACINHEVWNIPLNRIPERYFFRTHNNIGIDIRMLFFTSFINPVTHEPIATEDIEKLKTHPHLGFSVTTFHQSKDNFKLEVKAIETEVKDLNFFEKDWHRLPFSAKKQKIYDHFCSLAELVDHFDDSFLQQKIDEKITAQFQQYINFKQFLEKERKNMLFSEMSDSQFFSEAKTIIESVKVEMKSDWSNSTMSFFLAMEDFALNTDAVLKKASSGNIYSNNEYLVRVESIASSSAAKKAMLLMAHQFKTAFHVAFRYRRLPKLMDCMTPTGICIAEKMRHLAPLFSGIASIGPDNINVALNLHDLFATIMKKARAVEFGIWDDHQFLDYVVRNHANKEKYLDKHNVPHTLDEPTIYDYMKNTLLMEIPEYPKHLKQHF